MEPLEYGEVKDWLKENQRILHCYGQSAGSIAFAAWAALTTFRGRGVNPWVAINDGIAAVFDLADCHQESINAEQYFPESTKECQCARDGGQLIAELDAGLGAVSIIPFGDAYTAKEILDVGTTPDGNSVCQYKTTDNAYLIEEVERLDVHQSFSVKWYIKPLPGGVCCDEAPELPPRPADPIGFPLPVKDIDGNTCTLLVNHIDTIIDFRGLAWNKYQLTNPDDCPIYDPSVGFRLPFTCYWESQKGIIFQSCSDPPPFPLYLPDEDCNPGLNPITYTLHAGCSWNEEEQDYDIKFDYPIEGTSNGILGLARRLDAIAWMLDVQGLIDYRVCNEPTKPQLEGHWITTRWISDETMVHSGARLRKLFRYRSKSTRSLPELSEYWRSFTWKAGDVCVRHTGAWWGDPQVWAESEEEGQRVIRFAAAEAGIDPDQVGRWAASSSRSPRYGMSGTMKILQKEGFPWVASREGSSWPNELARLKPSPD